MTTPHVVPKDLPPKPLLQQLRHIKRAKKHIMVHPHITYPQNVYNEHQEAKQKTTPSLTQINIQNQLKT